MIIYEYKGGGYDGCWWEWNFFGIHEKKFYNIISSGYKGIKTEQDAKDLMNSEARFRAAKVMAVLKEIQTYPVQVTASDGKLNPK